MGEEVRLASAGEATKQSNKLTKQLTILGRGECGKTSILHRYVRGTFSHTLPATPIESEVLDFVVGEKEITLKVFDTSGQDDYSRFRALTIPDSDYVLICYSVVDPISFSEVEDTVIAMVTQLGRTDVKVILCSTKNDCKDENTIQTEEGRLLAERIGALKFFECSSLTGEGIDDIFNFVKNDIFVSKPEQPKNRSMFSFFSCCG